MNDFPESGSSGPGRSEDAQHLRLLPGGAENPADDKMSSYEIATFTMYVEPTLRAVLRELTPTADAIENAISMVYEIIARTKPSAEVLAAAMNSAKARAERRIVDYFIHGLGLELAAPADLSDAGRRATAARLSRVPGQRFSVVDGGKIGSPSKER